MSCVLPVPAGPPRRACAAREESACVVHCSRPRTIFAEDLGDLSGVDPAAEHVVEAGGARRDLQRGASSGVARNARAPRAPRERKPCTHLEHILSLVLDLERGLDLEPPEPAVAPEDLECAVSNLEVVRCEREASRPAKARLAHLFDARLAHPFDRLQLLRGSLEDGADGRHARLDQLVDLVLVDARLLEHLDRCARKRKSQGARHFAREARSSGAARR